MGGSNDQLHTFPEVLLWSRRGEEGRGGRLVMTEGTMWHNGQISHCSSPQPPTLELCFHCTTRNNVRTPQNKVFLEFLRSANTTNVWGWSITAPPLTNYSTTPWQDIFVFSTKPGMVAFFRFPNPKQVGWALATLSAWSEAFFWEILSHNLAESDDCFHTISFSEARKADYEVLAIFLE